MSTHAFAYIVIVGLMCGCARVHKEGWIFINKTNKSAYSQIPFYEQMHVFCVCICVQTGHRPVFLLTPYSRFGAEKSLLLADVAGKSPKDRRGETIPAKWHELMWLINTALIICKLHVWVHVTWEAYAACCVRPNKCQQICMWSESEDGPIGTEQGKREKEEQEEEDKEIREKRKNK